MATVMGATVALSTAAENIIAGRRFTVSVKLTESGGTNTNLVSIQPIITNGLGVVSTNIRVGTVANSATIGNYSGAAVTINANTSQTFNFDAVIDGPETYGQGGAEPICNYLVSALCQTSDGSVFAAPQITIPLNGRRSGAAGVYGSPSPAPSELTGTTKILGTTTVAYGNTAVQGSLQMDFGGNSGGLLILGLL